MSDTFENSEPGLGDKRKGLSRLSLFAAGACVFVVVLCFCAYKALVFNNLKKDLSQLLFKPIRPMILISTFTSDLEPPDEASLEDCMAFVSEFAESQEPLDLPSLTASISEILQAPEISEGILERVNPVLDLSLIPPTFFVPYGNHAVEAWPFLEFTARHWTSLGLSAMVEGRGWAASRIFFAVVLLGGQAQHGVPPFNDLYGRKRGLPWFDDAIRILIRCAPNLRLSRDQTAKMVKSLQAVENGLASPARILQDERTLVASIGKHLSKKVTPAKRTPYGRPPPFWRSPGKVLGAILEDPVVMDYLDKCYYAPAVAAVSGRWGSKSPRTEALEHLMREEKVRSKKGFREWFEFGLFPREYFKNWFLSEFALDPGSFLELDLKLRQRIRVAQWALAVEGFRNDKGIWPGSPSELETWLGVPLPGDIFSFSGRPLLFIRSPRPRVSSSGPDGVHGTGDDIVFEAVEVASITTRGVGAPSLPTGPSSANNPMQKGEGPE